MPEGYSYALVANAGQATGKTVRYNAVTHRYEPVEFPEGGEGIGGAGSNGFALVGLDSPGDLTDESVRIQFVFLDPTGYDEESEDPPTFLLNLPAPPAWGEGRGEFGLVVFGWSPGIVINVNWPGKAGGADAFPASLLATSYLQGVANLRLVSIDSPLTEDGPTWAPSTNATIQPVTGISLVTPVPNGEDATRGDVILEQPYALSALSRGLIGIDASGFERLNIGIPFSIWQPTVFHLFETETIVEVVIADLGSDEFITINQALIDSIREDDDIQHVWFRLHVGGGFAAVDPILGPQHTRNPTAASSVTGDPTFVLGKWPGFRIAPPIGVHRVEFTEDCEVALPDFTEAAPPPPVFRAFLVPAGNTITFDALTVGTFLDSDGSIIASPTITTNTLMEFTMHDPVGNTWIAQTIWSA